MYVHLSMANLERLESAGRENMFIMMLIPAKSYQTLGISKIMPKSRR